MESAGATLSTATSSCSSTKRSSHSLQPSDISLVGEEDDPLIPSPSKVHRTFHDGRATWMRLRERADEFQVGQWPTESLNLYLTLMNVPKLPQKLPLRELGGRPQWHVSGFKGPLGRYDDEWDSQDEWDPEFVYGRKIYLNLVCESPMRCDISTEAASCHLRDNQTTTGSLAILTMCWSYILSVQLLEMQGRSVAYTSHRLLPQTNHGENASAISLDGASPALIRWLCALLSPELGWSSNSGEGLPPWTSTLGGSNIVISVSGLVSEPVDPPSAAEATELLIEFCHLFGLGANATTRARGHKSLLPWTAGLLAALVLPLYRWMELQPRFAPTRLARAKATATLGSDGGASDGDVWVVDGDASDGGASDGDASDGDASDGGASDGDVWVVDGDASDGDASYGDASDGGASDGDAIRQHSQDLPYFSTLSLYPQSIGSMLWSMFWQPRLDCNLVSPWLASMLDILHPLIKAKDLDKLLKVFALRRPRVALWWLALFLLGDMSVLDWIRRYATTLNEKYGFGSQSPPDPIVFPWTGAIQSFLDFASRPHLSEAEQISNEDILRMRFNLKLQDSASVPVAWRPFGCRDKRHVEIELWPYLETGLIRRYLCFTWYSPKTGHRVHEEGFRRDTGRQIIWTTDDLKWVSTDSTHDDCPHSIKRAPSKDSTLRMMSMLVEDDMGGRHWSNSGFPGVLKDYAWLHDWEGLATMDVPENPAKAAIEASKPPSWFLQQWMIGAYDG